jgi:hypothetical protein
MKSLRDLQTYLFRHSLGKSEFHRHSRAGGNSKLPLNLSLAKTKRGVIDSGAGGMAVSFILIGVLVCGRTTGSSQRLAANRL